MKSDCCGAEIRLDESHLWRCEKCGRNSGIFPSDHIPDAGKKGDDHIVDATKKIEWPSEEEIEKAAEAACEDVDWFNFPADMFTAGVKWLRERMGVK